MKRIIFFYFIFSLVLLLLDLYCLIAGLEVFTRYLVLNFVVALVFHLVVNTLFFFWCAALIVIIIALVFYPVVWLRSRTPFRFYIETIFYN